MKCSYNFGPNAGQTFHAPRDQFIDILIKAGVLTLVEADKPGPHVANAESAAREWHTAPVWAVIKTPTGAYAIQCKFLSTVAVYDGEPEGAARFQVGPHVCPLDIADQYFRLKTLPVKNPEWLADQQNNAVEKMISQGGATRPSNGITYVGPGGK